MRDTRSAALKMSRETAPKDRRISKIPAPFIRAASYPYDDFDGEVKTLCDRCPIMSGLAICKTIFIGDVAVGKTSLVNRCCHQVFDSDYKATIGVDFEVERFDILRVPFNIQIWDTAGQERFRSIASSYYRGSHVIVVVFDLTNVQSLAHCSRWFQDATNVNPADDALRFLIGTKLDLVSPTSYADIERRAVKLAKEHSAEYWALSARTGENVENAFLRMAALAFNRRVLIESSSKKTKTLKIGNCLTCERKKEIHHKRRHCEGCVN